MLEDDIVNQNGWLPIETAPKDRVILVEDTNEGTSAPWAAAKWLEGEEWSGWVYDDEILNDSLPLGPQPTVWYDVPMLPARAS